MKPRLPADPLSNILAFTGASNGGLVVGTTQASCFWRDAASDHSLWRQRLAALWRSRSYVPGAWR